MDKITAYIFFLLFCCASVSSQSIKQIDKFKSNKSLNHAQIGVLIQTIDGKTIAELNKNMCLTPASTLKLITTATALDVLGDEFKYSTNLRYTNNKITIEGSGDPTLGSEYISASSKSFLAEWSKQVQLLKPVNPIDIYVQDDFFGYKGTSNKWIKEDLGNYYAAGAYGISVFDNAYRLYLNMMDVDNAPKIVRTDPIMSDLIFTNTLELNNTGKDNGYILGEPFSNRRLLTGDIPAKRNDFSIKGDIPDPGLLLGNSFAEILNTNGVKVGKVNTARSEYYSRMYPLSQRLNTNDSDKLFYTHQSVPLKDIIRVVNVRSNNHYSEHLIRTLGRQENKDIYTDALLLGIDFTSNYWSRKGFDTDALFMYDGCGLSPSNSISPQFMCEVLRYMKNESKYADAFINSLPKAGIEGTVKSFLSNTRLSGKVFVKSGSIANVQAYAGYYIDGNSVYTFSVIVNNFRNENRRNVVKAIETILLETLP